MCVCQCVSEPATQPCVVTWYTDLGSGTVSWYITMMWTLTTTLTTERIKQRGTRANAWIAALPLEQMTRCPMKMATRSPLQRHRDNSNAIAVAVAVAAAVAVAELMARTSCSLSRLISMTTICCSLCVMLCQCPRRLCGDLTLGCACRVVCTTGSVCGVT